MGIKRMKFAIAFAALSIFLFGSWVQAASDFIEKGSGGQVNWTRGEITAKGVGVPPTHASTPAQAKALSAQAAEVTARKNLIGIIKGVVVNSQIIVLDAMVERSEITEGVNGFVQGAHIVDKKEYPDGRVEVTVAKQLRREFSDLFYPNRKSPSRPAPKPVTAPKPNPQLIYTGLVIDARGLRARPALFPRILSEDGHEVYGSAFVSRNWAITEGMAAYSRDLKGIKSNKRVGKQPLIIKAQKASGPNRSDIFVSRSDARKIQDLASHLNFLDKAKVMIVLD
jgi:hypothetical protein